MLIKFATLFALLSTCAFLPTEGKLNIKPSKNTKLTPETQKKANKLNNMNKKFDKKQLFEKVNNNLKNKNRPTTPWPRNFRMTVTNDEPGLNITETLYFVNLFALIERT